jgi:hypothetical protein
MKLSLTTYDGLKACKCGAPLRRPARRAVQARCDWCALGAVAGFGGGLVVALSGSVLTAISWFMGARSAVQTAGTILLLLTIPLFIAGAQCLDQTDKKKIVARKGRFDGQE